MTDPRQSRGNDESNERGPGVWVGAAILIAVGVLFLLQNLGVAIPGNWWSLALLIPAGFSLAAAWRTYQADGQRFTGAMAGSLITALVLVALTLVFLFDLDVNWSVVWPLVLIAIGIGLVARTYMRK